MNQMQNAELLKNEDVACEIEMGKISKQKACGIVCKYFNDKNGCENAPFYYGGNHDAWACYDGQLDPRGNRRLWLFMDDGSSSGPLGRITCEMATPILLWDDIPDLQEVVRLLRKAGAKSGAGYNAGVHVHVGAKFDRDGGLTARSTRNLVNLIASHERLICDAVSVTPQRQRDWAKFVEPSFLRKINTTIPKTKAELEYDWYGYTGSHGHYDSTRYHLLNLHAIWDKGTIEFRCFEFHNNLHAGELKAWLQLCMAMVSYAKLMKRSSPEPVDASNPKYAMKSWLINMGLAGDEFKTCRKMLTKHLSGDSAYKVPRGDEDCTAGYYCSLA